MATETSSAVGNGYVKLGGTVDTVLSSPRIAPPPSTLEEARNQPGRLWHVFHHYKRDEWERYCAEVSDWDVKEYLDVLP